MKNDYNRKNLHNVTQNRKKVEYKEAEVLLSLFENKTHKQLAMLYYCEGYTLQKCADLMFISKRHIERIKKDVDNIAFYALLALVANSENAFKLSQIKKILLQESNNESKNK